MKKIQQFVRDNNEASIEFLRDALAYFNSRVETRNEDKTIEELLAEYVEVRKQY